MEESETAADHGTASFVPPQRVWAIAVNIAGYLYGCGSVALAARSFLVSVLVLFLGIRKSKATVAFEV